PSDRDRNAVAGVLHIAHQADQDVEDHRRAVVGLRQGDLPRACTAVLHSVDLARSALRCPDHRGLTLPWMNTPPRDRPSCRCGSPTVASAPPPLIEENWRG